jgi:hypothetical protein
MDQSHPVPGLVLRRASPDDIEQATTRGELQ